jgi:hypothetical protein
VISAWLITRSRTPQGSGDQAITVSYRPGLDAICSSLRGPSIQEDWKAELASRLAEYRRLWNEVGPRVLAAAEAITGLQRPAVKKVRLTLCNLPSQSILGISVNMRFALQSFTPNPVPLRYKVDTQLHEILHRMLDGHIRSTSRLLAEHADASRCVRGHLHLLALQKAVLLEVGDVEALADVVRVDSSLPDPCYKEAWEIVNASDSGYLSYVAEITAKPEQRPAFK